MEIIERQVGTNRVLVFRDRGIDHVLGWQSPDDVQRLTQMGERVAADPRFEGHERDANILWTITRAYRSDQGVAIIDDRVILAIVNAHLAPYHHRAKVIDSTNLSVAFHRLRDWGYVDWDRHYPTDQSRVTNVYSLLWVGHDIIRGGQRISRARNKKS